MSHVAQTPALEREQLERVSHVFNPVVELEVVAVGFEVFRALQEYPVSIVRLIQFLMEEDEGGRYLPLSPAGAWSTTP